MSQLENPNSLVERVEELEMKLTFQDELIEQLNQSLIEQQSDIRKLTRLLEKMGNEMKDMRESNIADQAQEAPPPHY